MERRALSAKAMLIAAVAGMAAAPACDDDDENAPSAPPIEVKGEKAGVSVTLSPFKIRFLDGAGREVLSTLTGGGDDPYGAPAATRDDGPDGITVIPGWDGYHPEERPWAHGATGKLLARDATTASFELDAGGQGTIRIDLAIDGAKVRLDEKAIASPSVAPGDAWNKMTISFALGKDDHFFGLGERFASLDHRGFSLYSWPEEGGAGKGEKVAPDSQNPFPNGPSMTYFPVPFFLSSAGYAMHLATTFRTETHFGSEEKGPDNWRIAINATSLTTIVYVHDDPLASLDDFTRDTGRPYVPAPWVFGPRRTVSNTSRVGDVLEWQKLRTSHVPTTGLDDNVHLLPDRSELGREDELKAWTQTAHAWGYKVMAYNNPYISISHDTSASDLAYGKEHGLFATNPDGTPGDIFLISGSPQTLATIDLTKPEGTQWFQELLRRSLALGYDGWMHDFGEYVRRAWKFGDGRFGDEVHNQYPVLSAKAAFDLLTKEKGNDFLFFVRSGYTGSQQYVPAVWGGDPEATFDETQGLPAMLRGGLNLGMSGVPLWGSDISGFKCITEAPNDKEMYLRWAEMGAMSPIMMDDNACSNPLEKRQKWTLWSDEETTVVYAEMARLHTRLMPYFEVLARAANATGIPIMRHPFLLHPKEPEAWKTASTFYLGPSLFTAPVVERGVTVRDVWLPPGKWVDFVDPIASPDRAVYEGGKHAALPAPLAKLPLLLRDGGIVPLLDSSIETLASPTEPNIVGLPQVADRLDVVVALSAGADAKITLADGTTLVARRAAASGPPSALPDVPADQLALCDGGCVHADAQANLDRLRVTTALAPSSTVTHQDMTLEATGPTARRIRWDVLRLR